MQPHESHESIVSSQAHPQVEITYYTDPLCSWSWAFEPQWRRLRAECGAQVSYRYVMGGLIRDWSSFSDPLNSVERPVQMGPLWIQTRVISGMPLNERIWVEDAPNSSYPACVAVKAATLLDQDLAERYLRRLREAVMLERCNIGNRAHLLAAAAEVIDDSGKLDAFTSALDHDAVEAFRDDLKVVRYHGVGRFPALVLRRAGSSASGSATSSIILVGYRPYEVLIEALHHVAPEIERQPWAGSAVDYARQWHSITLREVAEALAQREDETSAALASAVEAGGLARTETGLYRWQG